MKIAIVGCGNMGGSIALSLAENNQYEVYVINRNPEKALKLRDENKNINILEKLIDAKNFDVVIIAVKPQQLPPLYDELKALDAKLYISIAAGVNIKTLEEKLGSHSVARFMPNIAAKCKSSVTAVALGDGVENRTLPLSIAASFGSAFILPESQFPAFIGISGSAIAYVFEFIHYLALGGVKEGIPYKESAEIAKDTLISASRLMESTSKGAIELETMVCSAGGTTIEGVKALQDGSFGSAVMNAVVKAAERNKELEK